MTPCSLLRGDFILASGGEMFHRVEPGRNGASSELQQEIQRLRQRLAELEQYVEERLITLQNEMDANIKRLELRMEELERKMKVLMLRLEATERQLNQELARVDRPTWRSDKIGLA
jgi:chromosome segregation ATPase